MKTPTKAQFRKLTALYNRSSIASGKANALLNAASKLEQEMFGTTRNDTDRDFLIDSMEYSTGGYTFTIEEVQEIWENP